MDKKSIQFNPQSTAMGAKTVTFSGKKWNFEASCGGRVVVREVFVGWIKTG
jgi:hypothetical protein